VKASLNRLGGPLTVLAFLAIAFAAAYPMQVNGFNQNAHYALVRALDQGTPQIDRTRHEIGELGTNDVSIDDGHVYSNKAPGLALATLPAFEVVEATGMQTTGDPTRVIWALHLWSIVVPFFVLLLLLRDRAERIEPGLGTIVAITAGLGTLLLPFSTLFFAHVPTAVLGFAAFTVLWRERERQPRLALVLAGGILAGLAVTTAYELVLLGVVLGLYSISRGDVIRRGLSYAAGALLGVVPLGLYNLWAFGSLTHVSYENNQTGGPSDQLRGSIGFGISMPDLRVIHDLLFSVWGLLTLTPVLACGVAGGVLLLLRRRFRAEAAVCLGVVTVYFLWASSLGEGLSPFGGLGPPRYLVTMLPFATLGLAVAFRAFPVTTLALAALSCFQMAVQTMTNPLAAYDGDWWARLRAKQFSQTAASIVGVTGWYTITLLAVAVLVAGVAAALSVRHVRGPRWDMLAAAAALGLWVVIALRAQNPAGDALGRDYVVALVALLGVFAFAAAYLLGELPPRARRVRAAPS